MADEIGRLPDDIICCIFSLLPLRDAMRARLSRRRWKCIPDFRTVFVLDTISVFGDKSFGEPGHWFKFVKIVDSFLEVWKGEKISLLNISFNLGKEGALYVDKWIKIAIRMQVEELNVYACRHLLPLEHPSNLKRLSLSYCKLSFTLQSVTWLSQLTTLDLSYVSLLESDFNHVMSCGLNLTSLSVINCLLLRANFIHVRLPHLEKLVMCEVSSTVKIDCPKLQILEYSGRAGRMTFSHAPVLKKAGIMLYTHGKSCSLIFNDLTRHAPQLQSLKLYITTEAQPMPGTIVSCCLKKLELLVWVPTGFDLLTIVHLLNATPFLEILHLELRGRDYHRQSQQREFPDCLHFGLKEVSFSRFLVRWNMAQLASYLLKNAVALEQMVIGISGHNLKAKQKIDMLLEEKLNPRVDVIINEF